VGWGYGPQGTCTAQKAFAKVDVLLAVGVRFSEVSTGFYSVPQTRHVVHVDACADNLGRILRTDVWVHADAGVFLAQLLGHADRLRRPADPALVRAIAGWKADEAKARAACYARCGVDPMLLILALRRATCPDALVFVDVALAEHWAAE